jgi:hypothetical protein
MLCAFPLLSALTKRKGLGVNGFTLPLNFYGMRRRGVACFCFLTAILAACTNNDQKAAKKPPPDRIYLDYKISGEEENENVTCLIRFYRGGPNGPSLFLPAPYKVELDGRVLTADSTKYSGVYYEQVRPAREFSGTHRIVFTDKNNEETAEEFEFAPLRLLDTLPAKIKRGR